MNTLDIWQETKLQLRSYIARRVHGDAVDDILSDVAVKLVASDAKLEAIENLQAWLYRITSNAVVDYYRKQALTKKVHEQLSSDQQYLELPVLEDVSAELAKCLLPFIQKLPDDYQQALMLTDIGGVKQSEVAKKLKLSPSTMKSRVQRARKKLKEAVLRCCHIEINDSGRIVDFDERGDGTGCGC